MSYCLLDKDGLSVHRWTAEVRDDGGDRRRYTITTTQGRMVADLSAEQWAELGEFFSWQCSAECDGPHLICDGYCRHPGKD